MRTKFFYSFILLLLMALMPSFAADHKEDHDKQTGDRPVAIFQKKQEFALVCKEGGTSYSRENRFDIMMKPTSSRGFPHGVMKKTYRYSTKQSERRKEKWRVVSDESEYFYFIVCKAADASYDVYAVPFEKLTDEEDVKVRHFLFDCSDGIVTVEDDRRSIGSGEEYEVGPLGGDKASISSKFKSFSTSNAVLFKHITILMNTIASAYKNGGDDQVRDKLGKAIAD